MTVGKVAGIVTTQDKSGNSKGVYPSKLRGNRNKSASSHPLLKPGAVLPKFLQTIPGLVAINKKHANNLSDRKGSSSTKNKAKKSSLGGARVSETTGSVCVNAKKVDYRKRRKYYNRSK